MCVIFYTHEQIFYIILCDQDRKKICTQVVLEVKPTPNTNNQSSYIIFMAGSQLCFSSNVTKKCGEHLLFIIKVIPDLFLSKEEISQNNKSFFHPEIESYGEINNQTKQEEDTLLVSTIQCEHTLETGSPCFLNLHHLHLHKAFQPKILKCFNKHIHINHEIILDQIKKMKTFQKVHFCLRSF